MCARTYQIQLALQPYCTLPYHLTKLILPPYDAAASNPHKTINYRRVQLLTSDTPSPHETSEHQVCRFYKNGTIYTGI